MNQLQSHRQSLTKSWQTEFKCAGFHRVAGVSRLCWMSGITICLFTSMQPVHGQPSPLEPSEPSVDSTDDVDNGFITLSDKEISDKVRLAIEQLSHPNYRTRQMARTRLEQYPQHTVHEIQRFIQQADATTGGQLVDVLSGLALHNDLSISRSATQILHSLANQATSVGRSATNSLSAIADLQEEKAVEILSYQGAYIGPQNFSLNGKLDPGGGPLSLRIEDNFDGSQEDLEWIRYLKSVQVVYLRGSKITPEALRAVSQLKGLKAVKLRSVAITPELMLLLQELSSLEHLGLSYMDVDDSYVPVIAQLPISQSIRLYGTNVTSQGVQQLGEHFDGLEIFCGSGGFLGISSTLQQAQVDQVTAGSAAAEAGIQPGDVLLAVAGTKIATFEQLRNELGKFRAGDSVEILLNRSYRNRLTGEFGMLEMNVQATLKEEGP